MSCQILTKGIVKLYLVESYQLVRNGCVIFGKAYRLLSQRNMLHIILEIPVEGVDQALIAGELLEGQRRDKFRGVLRHQNLYVGAQFFQHTRQIYNFIRSDTAGHGQHRGLSF